MPSGSLPNLAPLSWALLACVPALRQHHQEAPDWEHWLGRRGALRLQPFNQGHHYCGPSSPNIQKLFPQRFHQLLVGPLYLFPSFKKGICSILVNLRKGNPRDLSWLGRSNAAPAFNWIKGSYFTNQLWRPHQIDDVLLRTDGEWQQYNRTTVSIYQLLPWNSPNQTNIDQPNPSFQITSQRTSYQYVIGDIYFREKCLQSNNISVLNNYQTFFW